MAKLRRGAIFKSVERTKVPFSTFDLSNQSVFSCKMGLLIPFMTVECVPGDRVRWNSNIFCRLAPLVNPVMHRMDIRGAFFFVPYRLLWNHWEEFRSEGNADVTASQRESYTVPQHPYWDYGSLWSDYSPSDIYNKLLGPSTLFDYLGFPSRQIVKQRAIPSEQNRYDVGGLFYMAAYYCVYDNYYRNQLLENSHTECLSSVSDDQAFLRVPEGYYLVDGDNTNIMVTLTEMENWGSWLGTNTLPAHYKGLCYANYEHDYFTSATYSPQLGDAVTLPLAGDVNFQTSFYNSDILAGQPVAVRNSLIFNRQVVQSPTDGALPVDRLTALPGATNLSLGVSGEIALAGQYKAARVTGSVDTGLTLREFRTLQALQRYKEKLLAYGTRFQEWLLGTYAVHDGDARLDRPEFIGAFSQPIQISEVLQTSSTSSEPSPLGDYAGRGISGNQTRNFNYMAPEDGVLIGIMQITPRTSYMCGLPRSWMRLNPYDYHNPMFEHVGEQEVYDNELYFSPANFNGSDVKGGVFGYNPRFAEYKYRPDEVHGDFLEDGMLSWHLSRDFSSTPTMTPGFFHASNIERIFAVTDSSYDKFYVQLFTKMIANRPMTMYSTPI